MIEEVNRGVRYCKAVSDYFAIASVIDEHNHFRQGSLAIERKILTKDWEMRIFSTMLGIMEVDAWRIFDYVNIENEELKHKEFPERMTEFLLNNPYQGLGREFEGTMRPRPSHDGAAAAVDDDEMVRKQRKEEANKPKFEM